MPANFGMFLLKLRYPCCPGKGKFKLPEGSVRTHPCICFDVLYNVNPLLKGNQNAVFLPGHAVSSMQAI